MPYDLIAKGFALGKGRIPEELHDSGEGPDRWLTPPQLPIPDGLRADPHLGRHLTLMEPEIEPTGTNVAWQKGNAIVSSGSGP